MSKFHFAKIGMLRAVSFRRNVGVDIVGRHPYTLGSCNVCGGIVATNKVSFGES